jgi:Family of unknown function (DUF6499)
MPTQKLVADVPWPRWDQPQDYAYLLAGDLAGLAWEWLRRSQEYQRLHENVAAAQRHQLPAGMTICDALPPADAATSGLHFR